ncbi:hypothetical protein MATL_G00096100 [Megalops atlanticus]|uniref:Uncharacterized protein n=1 Tax=Megalops atlanticus TaxID=7932 RepID=A0A9D3Q0X8_MEGAT|nr:hypothetical protein MATL_G00096100 [Megalops atlanticus]
MLFIPNGMLLNRCVCDGVERPFCEVVKENMGKLCAIGDHGVSTAYGEMDDMYEDEDYELKTDREDFHPESGVSFSSSTQLSPRVTLLQGILLLTFCWTRPF